eukprot:GILJ01016270.1.p1 GENE.GILJ01016270.1~~GILJ01016270.1.p1  ORF type:complete len:451 (+),score=70.34 GILJ01016270.1:60-1412(+)
MIQNQWQVLDLVGHGGFGEVYKGIDTRTNRPVAIKVEPKTPRSWLYHEARIMKDLNVQGVKGVPSLHYFGEEANLDHRFLIMSFLGLSLEDLHERHQRFSLKTTLMLMYQMVSLLQRLHAAGYVHRDLKPDNFLLGTDAKTLFLIDFGLSNKYVTADGENNTVHKPMQTERPFIGTTRYASLNTHKGVSQSRRDDLESLIYIGVYMYRGRLPWTGLNINDRDAKERKIGELKETLTADQICSRCPIVFPKLLAYARQTQFEDALEYDIIRSLINQTLDRELSEKFDHQYDWIAPPADRRSPMGTSLASRSNVNGIGGFGSGLIGEVPSQLDGGAQAGSPNQAAAQPQVQQAQPLTPQQQQQQFSPNSAQQVQQLQPQQLGSSLSTTPVAVPVGNNAETPLRRQPANGSQTVLPNISSPQAAGTPQQGSSPAHAGSGQSPPGTGHLPPIRQ